MNIKFEKINSLLDVAYKNKVRLIKTKTLNEAGINNYDIKKFVDAEILKKQSHGVYKIIYKTLYFYAKDLRRANKLDEALQCFSKIGKVYEMNSLNYQMLQIYLLKEDYRTASKLISKMYYKEFSDNPKRGYSLLYAYLTNILFLVSIDIKELRIKLIEWNKRNPSDLKDIVDACLNNNFAQALEYLKKLNNPEISHSKLEILEKLIDNCKRKTQSRIDKLVYYCKEERYEEAKDYILNKKNKGENIHIYDAFYNTIITYLDLTNNQTITDKRYTFLLAIEQKLENNFDEVLKMLFVRGKRNINPKAKEELKRLLKKNIELAKKIKNNSLVHNELVENEKADTINNIDNCINSKINEIKNINGIVILNSIADYKTQNLIDCCLSDPCINVLTYGDGPNKRIALIACEKNLNPLQIDNLFKKFQLNFNKGNYFDALEIGKILLKNGDNSSLILSNLGMCYFNLKHYEDAIEYFNLAINLSDNDEEIRSLKEYILEAKSEYGFCDESTVNQNLISEAQFYGINCLDEILNFQIKYNTNLEIACLHFGLDVYQINIVKLILAKKYYQDNLDDLGYEYYYSVLTSNFKNNLLNLLLNEFNDKFINYKNYAFMSRSFKKNV